MVTFVGVEKGLGNNFLDEIGLKRRSKGSLYCVRGAHIDHVVVSATPSSFDRQRLRSSHRQHPPKLKSAKRSRGIGCSLPRYGQYDRQYGQYDSVRAYHMGNMDNKGIYGQYCPMSISEALPGNLYWGEHPSHN